MRRWSNGFGTCRAPTSSFSIRRAPGRGGRVPAAVPLIAYAAGLACGHSYAEAIGFALIALLLLGVRRPSTLLRAGVSAAFAVAALAGGVFAAVHQRAVRETNLAALDAL